MVETRDETKDDRTRRLAFRRPGLGLGLGSFRCRRRSAFA
jgi:hypothetical protein